jgi:hypothetical protein
MKMSGYEGLTSSQVEFARRAGAVPGVRPDWDEKSVFMYREDSTLTWRWLVDATGEIVETAWFRRACNILRHPSAAGVWPKKESARGHLDPDPARRLPVPRLIARNDVPQVDG